MSSISVSAGSAAAADSVARPARALARRRPSGFSPIYIQIDLEVNLMSLFPGSQRTR